jgi:hypothetical protein
MVQPCLGVTVRDFEFFTNPRNVRGRESPLTLPLRKLNCCIFIPAHFAAAPLAGSRWARATRRSRGRGPSASGPPGRAQPLLRGPVAESASPAPRAWSQARHHPFRNPPQTCSLRAIPRQETGKGCRPDRRGGHAGDLVALGSDRNSHWLNPGAAVTEVVYERSARTLVFNQPLSRRHCLGDGSVVRRCALTSNSFQR